MPSFRWCENTSVVMSESLAVNSRWRNSQVVCKNPTKSFEFTKVVLRNVFSALTIAMWSASAVGVSIGTVQGSVILGQPLDVSFPVLSDSKAITDVCVRGSVSANGTPVSQSQVRITPTPGVAGKAATVRVQTTQVVSEPVMSVRLVVGCDASVVRNFNLLAYPAEALAAQAPVLASAPLISQQSLAVASNPGASPRSATLPPNGPQARAKSSEARAPTGRRSDAISRIAPRKPAVAARSKEVSPEGSRLVMEPLSDWLQAPSMLRVSPELASALPDESEVPPERAAAAALWRMLNMQPDELVQQLARIDEQVILLADAERARAAAVDSQKILEEKASNRFPATVVYVLALLLALLAALCVWLWSRARRQAHLEERAWAQSMVKNGTPISEKTEPVQQSVAANSLTPTAPVTRAAADTSSRLQPTEPELLPSGMMPLEFEVQGSRESPTSPSHVDAALQKATPAHAVVNPEALFDLQQQAEFFVSVGEHGQAIAVLKQHIHENQATSPLAYLELMRLYRSLSRIEDFNNLRAQMHLYFNVQVPEFAAFARPGKTLFGYPEVLARIEALWPEAHVVAVLQALLFRDSSEEHQRFALLAYDDLLLLHAVAGTTVPSARGNLEGRARTTSTEPLLPEEPPQAFGPVALAPVDNLMEFEPDWEFEAPERSAAAATTDPGASLTLDLDLSDLTHLGPPSEATDPSLPLPHLTNDDLSPVVSIDSLADDQPVGFGANSDRFEARVDPDVRKTD